MVGGPGDGGGWRGRGMVEDTGIGGVAVEGWLVGRSGALEFADER